MWCLSLTRNLSSPGNNGLNKGLVQEEPISPLIATLGHVGSFRISCPVSSSMAGDTLSLLCLAHCPCDIFSLFQINSFRREEKQNQIQG